MKRKKTKWREKALQKENTEIRFYSIKMFLFLARIDLLAGKYLQDILTFRNSGIGRGSNFARRGFQASLSVTGQAAVDGGGGAL